MKELKPFSSGSAIEFPKPFVQATGSDNEQLEPRIKKDIEDVERI
jgi:hypothetical protein